MKVSIEKTEHYALFSIIDNNSPKEAWEELCKASKDVLDTHEFVYFIFDLNPWNEFEDMQIHFMQSISEKLVEVGGLLISVHSDSTKIEMFEQQHLILVPRIDEAIEYIYMDQLEKQFLGDNED